MFARSFVLRNQYICNPKSNLGVVRTSEVYPGFCRNIKHITRSLSGVSSKLRLTLRLTQPEVYPKFRRNFDLHNPKFTRSLPGVYSKFRGTKVEVSTCEMQKHCVLHNNSTPNFDLAAWKLRLITRSLQTSNSEVSTKLRINFDLCWPGSHKIFRSRSRGPPASTPPPDPQLLAIPPRHPPRHHAPAHLQSPK